MRTDVPIRYSANAYLPHRPDPSGPPDRAVVHLVASEFRPCSPWLDRACSPTPGHPWADSSAGVLDRLAGRYGLLRRLDVLGHHSNEFVRQGASRHKYWLDAPPLRLPGPLRCDICPGDSIRTQRSTLTRTLSLQGRAKGTDRCSRC